MGDSVAGRILIVDADYRVLSDLGRVLRHRGHQVVVAANGRGGLQRAIEIAADVVVIDRDVPVLDVRSFLVILRDNPRTASAHVFIMGSGEHGRLSAVDGRAETILKPFHPAEVASRIEEVLRRRRNVGKEQELRGALQQASLFDLLQVFAANRRTGKLRIQTGAQSGEIWMHEGRVVDASFGATTGTKALFRALALTRGSFAFVPNVRAAAHRIEASTDHLLMEAVRESDEVSKIREELPPLESRIEVKQQPSGASEDARAVLSHLAKPRRIAELLDLLPASDLTVLQGVRELIEHSALKITEPDGQQVEIFAKDEQVAAGAALTRLRRARFEGPVRIGILVESKAQLHRFTRALSATREFAASSGLVSLGEAPLGTVGFLRIGSTEVELFALGPGREVSPLWGIMMAPVTAVLSLVTDETALEALDDTFRLLDLRRVQAPSGWDTPQGAVHSLREVFGDATRKFAVLSQA